MITVYTIIVLIAISIQAFFTAAEMAFTSVNKLKLKGMVDSGDLYAIKLDNFLHEEGLYLGTTLVGTNIAIVIASVLATRIFTEYFGVVISPFLVTIVLVPVSLVLAEIIPKMIARQFSLEMALKIVVPVKSFFRLFSPLISTVNFIARLILLPFKKVRSSADVSFTKSDLKGILLLGHESGGMEADEVELIHKVLDFGAKKVEQIMVPLYRISSISIEDDIDVLKRLISLTGFSRIPVYRENKKNIIGIINIYDILFNIEDKGEELTVTNFIRDPIFVKRDDGLDIALARLRHQKQPMGIVTDGKRHVVGIVTIEDILEEIVGEIEDTG